MTSIASAIAGHPLVALTVGLVVTVAALGTGLVLAGAEADRPSDILATLAYVVVGSLSFTVVGAIILVRRPGHRIGRLMIAMGVTLALGQAVPDIIDALAPAIVPPGSIAAAILASGPEAGMLAIVLGAALLIVWFPDGRTSSRLGTVAQTLAAALAITQVARIVDPSVLAQSEVGFVLIIGAYALALIDLVARYRRSDSVRRTQIRWVLASGSVTTALVVGILATGDRIDWIWQAWLMSTILPAFAVGIAITRYRLYDIDRIISQGIAYTIVTATLFAVVAVGVLTLPVILTPQVDGNGLAVAASTLIAAILFQPLRSRVQRVVDRRFHRSRYDAERTVDGFAARLRDQLDLPTLTLDLRRTANDAVEPVTTDVWLRPVGEAR